MARRDVLFGTYGRGAAGGSLSAFVLPPRSECLFFYTFFLLLRGPCVCFCALCPRASVSVCPQCVCLCCLSLSVLVDCVCPVLWRLLCPEKGQPADKSLECAVRDEMRCDEVPISERCTLQRQIVRVPGVCGKGVRGVLRVWYRGVQVCVFAMGVFFVNWLRWNGPALTGT